MLLRLHFGCLFAFVFAPLVCAQTESPRPLQEVFRTDLVYTQDRGEIQLTTGSNASWNHGNRLIQWPAQAEYGVTDSWQLQLDWQGWERQTQPAQPAANGPGDLSLGTKYSFMDLRGSRFHAAVSFDVGLPIASASQGLGQGFLTYEPSVMVARDLQSLRSFQLFTQAGIELVQQVRARRNQLQDKPAAHRLNWGGGFFLLLRRTVVTSEISWETDRWNHGGRDNELYLTPGTVWKLPGRWECGAGVSFGATPTSDRVAVLVKFTREFHSRKAGGPVEMGASK